MSIYDGSKYDREVMARRAAEAGDKETREYYGGQLQGNPEQLEADRELAKKAGKTALSAYEKELAGGRTLGGEAGDTDDGSLHDDDDEKDTKKGVTFPVSELDGEGDDETGAGEGTEAGTGAGEGTGEGTDGKIDEGTGEGTDEGEGADKTGEGEGAAESGEKIDKDAKKERAAKIVENGNKKGWWGRWWKKHKGKLMKTAIIAVLATMLVTNMAGDSARNGGASVTGIDGTSLSQDVGGGEDEDGGGDTVEDALRDMGVETGEMDNGAERHEHFNGVTYSYSDYLKPTANPALGERPDAEHKSSDNAFGTSRETLFGDKEGSIESIMKDCDDKPEVLAAISSFFPSILRGIETENAELSRQISEALQTYEQTGDHKKLGQQLDDLMSNDETGKELKAKLLAGLEQVITNADADFHFYYENDSEDSYYMFTMLSEVRDDSLNPSQVYLDMVNSKRNNAAQLRITLGDEYADLNMYCGWQPNIDPNAPDAPKTTTTETETPPENPETPPENPETPPENPPETPPETPPVVVPKTEDTHAGGYVAPAGVTPETPASGNTPVTRESEVRSGGYVEDTATVAPGTKVNRVVEDLGKLVEKVEGVADQEIQPEFVAETQHQEPNEVPVVGDSEAATVTDGAGPYENPEAAAGDVSRTDADLAARFSQLNGGGQ